MAGVMTQIAAPRAEWDRLNAELEAAQEKIAKLRTELADEFERNIRLVNDLSDLVPLHYDGDEAAEAYIHRWANDAARVVQEAHAWRALRDDPVRGPKCAKQLDAAVEKIYPVEDYA